MINPINRLRGEHSVILKELDFFERYLTKIGNNLNIVKKFINLFDNKIYHIIKLEERVLFPYLEKYIDKDGPLFVMSYTHEKIEEEFERLRKVLSKQEVYDIRKSGEKLVKVLRYHIGKEDDIILREAEKRLNNKQISHLSNMFVKLIQK